MVTLRPDVPTPSQFTNAVKSNHVMDIRDRLTDEERHLIASVFHHATVLINTLDDRQDERSSALKAANLKVRPADWAYPQKCMLYETETAALLRSHNHDGRYTPTEIRIFREGARRALKWALSEGSFEDPPRWVDEMGPGGVFKVWRCYYLKVDPWKECPVKVLYKRWNKDVEDDDFFLHSVLIPLVLLRVVAEEGAEED
jgi:hypothetical protein